jgi:hypothetical protein
MDSVKLIAIFLFIIVIELAVLIWLYADINKVSSFNNSSYLRSAEEVQSLWNATGCNKPLTNDQINIYRRFPYKIFISAIRSESQRCLNTQKGEKRSVSQLDYLMREHENILKNMWVNADCGNKVFPAQRLNSIFKRQYTLSIDKNIIFESMKNWLNGEIEDICG